MKLQFYFVISAFLLVGCATTKETHESRPTAITRIERESLQAQLQELPDSLHKALSYEIQSVKNSADSETISRTNTDLLLGLLSHTSNPDLLPDPEFNSLFNVVKNGVMSSQKLFVKGLTSFINQSNFDCEQPIFARYFQHRFAAKTSSTACKGKVPFYVLSHHQGASPVWLDPRRVRAIHLLFAGNGEGMVSRFGHVALRLVVCPEIDSTDEICDLNLTEHVVLGFGAHVNDMELDIIKALKGGYSAYLFAYPFIEAYQDYAISEFREIYSLPLIMNLEQREQMVRELAEIHWRFSDEYHFFSKNCTSLLQQAMKSLLPNFKSSTEMENDYIRPDHFFEAIKLSSLADGKKISSLEQAEQDGYYFSSTKLFYDQAVAELKVAMLEPKFSDVKTYLEVEPAVRINNIKQDQVFFSRLKKDSHLRDAQILLEELSMIRSERRLMVSATSYFHEYLPVKMTAIVEKLNSEQLDIFENCLLTPLSLSSHPLQRTIGIPNELNITVPENRAAVCKKPEGRERLFEVMTIIGEVDPENWQPIAHTASVWKESIANVICLKNDISAQLTFP